MVGTSSLQSDKILNSAYLSGVATLHSSETIISFEKWDVDHLTYSFQKNIKSPDHKYAHVWNENISIAAADVFSKISGVTHLRFEEVDGDQDADLKFWLYHSPDNVYGYSYGIDGSGIYINSANIMNPEILINSFDYVTIAHEILHNLGLTHPFDGYAQFPGVINLDDLGSYSANQNIYTVTSYNEVGTTSEGGVVIGPPRLSDDLTYGLSSLGVIDQAYLQVLYGENQTTNSGDELYLIAENSEKISWTTIWDTAGYDTIEVQSTSDKPAIIDLSSPLLFDDSEETNLGGISKLSGRDNYGGFVIGNSVDIENAKSGTGNDQIIGNSLNNFIFSSGGNNTIEPLGGDDLILLGEGDDLVFLTSDSIWSEHHFAKNVSINQTNATSETISLSGFARYNDHIFGGKGNDSIYLTDQNDAYFLDDRYSNAHEEIFENAPPNALVDKLTARVNQVETVYGGAGNDILDFSSSFLKCTPISLNGQAGDDVLWGGISNDTLNGGTGSDRLNGGLGNDVLMGETGENIFSFAGYFGHDVIQDWEEGNNKIETFNVSKSLMTNNDATLYFGEFGSISFYGREIDEILLAKIDFI